MNGDPFFNWGRNNLARIGAAGCEGRWIQAFFLWLWAGLFDRAVFELLLKASNIIGQLQNDRIGAPSFFGGGGSLFGMLPDQGIYRFFQPNDETFKILTTFDSLDQIRLSKTVFQDFEAVLREVLLAVFPDQISFKGLSKFLTNNCKPFDSRPEGVALPD